MLRVAASLALAAALPVAAVADGHLAGAPIPEVSRSAAGDCRMDVTTQVENGVRVHRSAPVGCAPARAATPTPAQAGQSVDVNVKAEIFAGPRRFGTDPFVLGSPGFQRAREGKTGYVLGSPRP
ncbi:MAG: hypothetical protein AAGH87_02875 [Pseudomonadota bacterium]